MNNVSMPDNWRFICAICSSFSKSDTARRPRMIAVAPRNRYKNADELLEAIDDVWTQQALRALKQGS